MHDCPTLKFQLSCSSLVCWWRLWPHFIIHKTNSRETYTLVVIQQDPQRQLDCLFCSRYCTASSTYIWTWHDWDFCFLELLNYDCGIQNILEETAPPWTWNLRTQWDIWQLSDTLWEVWEGVFLLHCFMTHHVSILSSSARSILLSFLPSAPRYLPLQHTRHGPAVWTVGLSRQLTVWAHTNNLPYEKETFCYCGCKKQNEGALQNHKRFWF